MQNSSARLGVLVEKLLRLYGNPGVLRERKENGRPGLIDLAQSTWYGLLAEGKAPAPIRIGRSTFWLERDLEEFIERAKNGKLK